MRTISKSVAALTRLNLIGLSLAAGLLAQTITSIQNPASNVVSSLPNFGIAQGSIFVLYGGSMGPSAISTAPRLPLGTSLAGTSVTVIAGGLTFSPFMVYTLASQVAAVMPSSVPAGPATVQVTYNGTAGPAFNTIIVTSDFGISTVNQTGGGAAVITYPTTTAPFYSVVTNTNSTKPGSTYTMWGTGLGAATSDSNIASGDLGTPIQVFVGGSAAGVTYRGRSGSPGLDQINFIVPQGTATGCAVSLIVQTTGLVSNNTTIPVAATGGTCSDTVSAQPLNSATLSSLTNNKSVIRFGLIDYWQQVPNQRTSPTPIYSSQVTLFSVGQADFPAWQDIVSAEAVSPGSCVVRVTYGQPADAFSFAQPLNAGTTLRLTPPSGASLNLVPDSSAGGNYTGTPASYQAGTFGLSGVGGPDLGAFAVNFVAPPLLTLTNRAAIMAASPSQGITGTVLDRTKPLTLTWTGGDPNGFADILLDSGLFRDNVLQTSIEAECVAPLGSGMFTVPPNILLALPPTVNGASSGNGWSSAIHFESVMPLQVLNAAGLDAMVAQPRNRISTGVDFK